MPNKIMRPTAIGSYDGIPLGAGASKVAAVDPGDPVSHDDNTSYLISNVTATVTQAFQMTVVTGVASVNSFTQKARVRTGNITPPGESSGNFYGRLRRAGVESANTVMISPDWPAGYNNLSITALRPAGGGWIGGDFDGTVIEGVYLNGGDGAHDEGNFDPNNYFTSFWLELNYNPAAGGFVRWWRRHFGDRLVNIQISDMPAMAYIGWVREEELILPQEYAPALRELREFRFRKVFV